MKNEEHFLTGNCWNMWQSQMPSSGLAGYVFMRWLADRYNSSNMICEGEWRFVSINFFPLLSSQIRFSGQAKQGGRNGFSLGSSVIFLQGDLG